jgi:hypothetical protein
MVVRRKGGVDVIVKEALFYRSAKCKQGEHFACIEILESNTHQSLCDCECHLRPARYFGCIGAYGHYMKVRRVIAAKEYEQKGPSEGVPHVKDSQA